MKDQIATDLGVMGAKIAPPVAVAAGTAAGAVNPQSLLVWITIAYTVAMFATFIIKNVGEWEGGASRDSANVKLEEEWLRDD